MHAQCTAAGRLTARAPLVLLFPGSQAVVTFLLRGVRILAAKTDGAVCRTNIYSATFVDVFIIVNSRASNKTSPVSVHYFLREWADMSCIFSVGDGKVSYAPALSRISSRENNGPAELWRSLDTRGGLKLCRQSPVT